MLLRSNNASLKLCLFPISSFGPALVNILLVTQTILRGASKMFRKLIITWPVWMTLPIRLALGVIFVAHGAGKVLGSFEGPGLAKFTSSGPAPFAFMRPSWLWFGAAAFFRTDWRCPDFSRIAHTSGSVLYCLRDADSNCWNTLAKLFCAQKWHRVSDGIASDVSGAADLRWGKGLGRPGNVGGTKEVNRNGKW
jgi:hypothetical protein